MPWRAVGSISPTATSGELVVGRIQVPPQGGVEVRMRQTSSSPGFRFAFGLLSYVSPLGRELGTIKVWPDQIATDYRLGAGLSALGRDGNLTFEARSYNLAWVRAGYPLDLSFWVDEPGNLPDDRYLAPGFENPQGRLLRLVQIGEAGRLRF